MVKNPAAGSKPPGLNACEGRRRLNEGGGPYNGGRETAPARGALGPFRLGGCPGAAGTIHQRAISATVPHFERGHSLFNQRRGHAVPRGPRRARQQMLHGSFQQGRGSNVFPKLYDVIAPRQNLAAFFVGNWNVRNKAFQQRGLPNLFLGGEGTSDLLVTFKQCIH